MRIYNCTLILHIKPTQGHEGEVGHGAVPDGHLYHLRLVVPGAGEGDLLGAGGDLLDGAHEEVRHDRDPEEAVEQTHQVEGAARALRPGDLPEQRQHHALAPARAKIFVNRGKNIC